MRLAVLFAALALSVAGCATRVPPPDVSAPAPVAGESGAWGAYGYLAPGRTDGGEFIGAYPSKAACQEAVDGWMARQVVGNPVSGECLPVDPR